MCLYYNEQATIAFRKSYKEQRVLTCYKVLTKELRGIFKDRLRWRPGRIISNRDVREPGKDPADTRDGPQICVQKGIHVFTAAPAALRFAYPTEIVLPVRYRLSDLIAVEPDRHTAVFMRVFVRKDDFTRATTDKEYLLSHGK